MSGGKAPKNTTTTSKTEPADEVKPYLSPFMESASSLASQPYEAYDGTTVAPLNDLQTQAVSNIQARALNGSAVGNAAQSMLSRTAGNDYLNYGMSLADRANPMLGMNNPFLNEAIGRAQQDVVRNYQDAVMPRLDAAKRTAGSFGNSGQQEMELRAQNDFTREMGGISSSMRMQDYGLQAQLQEAHKAALLNMYQTERGNQMQAASLAPQIAEMDYRDMQALLGAGDILRNYEGEKLNERYNNWLAQQQWPYQQLDVLGNAIGRTMGAGGTTTQTAANPYQPSRTASAIGGGALGYAGAQAMGMDNAWLGGLLGAGAGYGLG